MDHPPRQTRSATKIEAVVKANYRFYNGSIPSAPDGAFIDLIHRHWWHNHDKLEIHHGYIQWLFPVFESGGMNYESQNLGKEEAALMRKDFKIATRFVTSYKMILNFFGMELDCMTGTVSKNPNQAIWKTRSSNMDFSTHNHLRITRILMSLSHLGFAAWKEPFLNFLKEQIDAKELVRCGKSYNDFWKETINTESASYLKKTKEEPSDRTPSVYFEHLKKKSPSWRKFQQRLSTLHAEQETDRNEAIKRMEILYQATRAPKETKKRKADQTVDDIETVPETKKKAKNTK